MPLRVKRRLPVYRRIKQSSEFRLALNFSKLNNKWFVVYIRPNGKGISRLGMIISKNIISKAVTRNFIKRLIREEFRRNFPTRDALDIVVRVRQPLDRENANTGHQALIQLLHAAQT